jgi:hypothetical protein
MKYVYVTYDPLLEQVICVHQHFTSECKLCKKIRKKRVDENSPYHIRTMKFKIKN